MNQLMNVIPVTLRGQTVQLEPLSEIHREPLRQAADDERIWQFTLSRPMGPDFDRWFDALLAPWHPDRQLSLAVRQLTDNRLIGCTGYLEIEAVHHTLEIGGTWYSPDVWQTNVNPECKFLLLQHAFETLRANRVHLCTDVRNQRSQAAIAKLGAVREGILRAHLITQGGRVRDSVLFSIIADEWPQVRVGLRKRLGMEQ